MMPSVHQVTPIFICRKCSITVTRPLSIAGAVRHISQSRGHQRDKEQPADSTRQLDGLGGAKAKKAQNEERRDAESEEEGGGGGGGAMSRRLQEATEEALFTGGKAGVRAVSDAGFSEELKEKLLEKIEGASVRREVESGDAAPALVAERAWTGEEATPDAVLRMLDDAHKPLRPDLRGQFRPPVVDPRARRKRSAAVATPGQRAAEARDKASMYAQMGIKAENQGLSEQEKQELKEEFRARFEASARAVPATISGLAALANERIEEAIARGQFKHLPSRGKPVEADPMASNPYVDTTEYLMNRIIQRQEIVPPWIEKQQELGKAIRAFRVQLRTNWRRHAARMIASRGGSLEEQTARAQEHAAAERVINSDENGPSPPSPPSPPARPFRDTAWEKAEHAYLQLSVDTINSLTRSYNLMAPELAKKPYLSLQRELASCYADVAPSVAGEIRQRALQPGSTTTAASSPDSRAEKGSGMMGVLRGDDSVRIYERKGEKPYGLREWWRDVWNRE